MQHGLNFIELATEIERQSKAKNDVIVGTQKLEMAEDGKSVAIRGESMPFQMTPTDTAHGQIATRSGIPTRYYRRLRQHHPDLLASQVNELWKREPKTRMVRECHRHAVQLCEALHCPRTVVRVLAGEDPAPDGIDEEIADRVRENARESTLAWLRGE